MSPVSKAPGRVSLSRPPQAAADAPAAAGISVNGFTGNLGALTHISDQELPRFSAAGVFRASRRWRLTFPAASP